MRLEKIKIAGFKSFVEPTTVLLPSHLVGVVGPNGCGKSNVIDAVRWVMGESSAKMLRGESMADVIFNGSTSRKPVGTASIELVFDNSDGRAGGQYASYNQISVRRSVSRDGQSGYALNGMRCRRRDITDLFLGTGLGPRSYSIIEQGMISRLIEARPEDLRLFLEEAAGISKYKERRRETETRIRHTRENLDRLNDLREEVSKQLRHLERQAATAEKYKTLKQQERRGKAELLALRWAQLAQEHHQAETAIAQQETQLEARLAEQRRLEAGLEQLREQQLEGNDRFNAEQSRFYAVGAEISRLEQQIRFARENRQRLERDLGQTRAELERVQEHQGRDQAGLEEKTAQLAERRPQLQLRQEEEQQIAAEQQAYEQQLHGWQADWDEFNQRAAQPAQTAQVERARITQLEQQQDQLQRRGQRLQEEQSRLESSADQARLEGLELDLAEAQEQADQAEQALSEQLLQIEQRREQLRQQEQQLRQRQNRNSELAGRIASLNTLQQAALGKETKGDQGRRLAELGLTQAARLAEQLQVEPGWRQALEAVLGPRLQAICVEDLDALGLRLSADEPSQLCLLGCLAADHGLPSADLPSADLPSADLPSDSLLRRLQAGPASAALAQLLHGARCAESSEQALQRRGELAAGEYFVTPEGLLLGANWLLAGRDQRSAGTLQREEELRALGQEAGLLGEEIEQLSQALEEQRSALQELEQAQEQQRRRHAEAGRRLTELRSLRAGLVSRIEHVSGRRRAIDEELQEIEQQRQQAEDDIKQARTRLHQALEQTEACTGQRQLLIEQRDALRQRLGQVRDTRNRLRGQVQELALQVQALDTACAALDKAQAQAEQQQQRLRQRASELSAQLAEAEAPLQLEQAQLEAQLEQRLQVEQALAEARDGLAQLDQQLRQYEQQRHQSEQQASTQRDRLEQARLHQQELKVRWSTLAEQLAETGYDSEELLAQLEPGLELDQLQARLEDLGQQIERLGRVNLAAIDEFKEQSERMSYLDAQHADISSSLEVLEEAIRKIDRETRARFKETFDKVNSGLQELFPKLFGGGHAYLQMTGDDLLDTGVSVMARPPGKRNSSIQLLSGGEKALTAVAMVFAIFQLNPAPFCMLDEVDAPLDDANVQRFCNMVKEMSDKVQFIFITHNKVTMEMSHQLIGVTMHEPGVSRIVSVDIAEAAKLAGA
jgi:chromosome segregation protein